MPIATNNWYVETYTNKLEKASSVQIKKYVHRQNIILVKNEDGYLLIYVFFYIFQIDEKITGMKSE